MKIRNGFVSNSSSSSYLIYGWCLDINYSEDLKFLADILEIDLNKILELKLKDLDDYDFVNDLNDLANKKGINILNEPYENDEIYVGVALNLESSDEELKEMILDNGFKKAVDDILKNIIQDSKSREPIMRYLFFDN